MKRITCATAASLLLSAGCGRVEWNWDWAWWKSPRRVVPPSGVKPEPTPSPTREESTDVEPPRADAGPTRPSAAEITLQARQSQRPFYQVYLVSSSVASATPRGESRIELKHANARSCASLLEWLVIPTGRSGSPDECYLLYEDRSEFERAIRLAPWLDVPSQRDTITTPGPEEAFRVGVGMMLSLADELTVVEAARLEACERKLSEAMQSDQLPALKRWTACVLAGHLLADYRYAYDAARRCFAQAERLTENGSIEQLTALYWRADALRQAGRTDEAAALYQRIVEHHEAAAGVQIASLSRAALKEKRK